MKRTPITQAELRAFYPGLARLVELPQNANDPPKRAAAQSAASTGNRPR